MKNSGIVERLNIAKKQRGLTLQKLAEKSQLTVGTVNKIMSGALLDIKMDKLQKLAKALDVTTEYLLGNESNQQISDTPTVVETHYLGLVKIACVSPQVRVADCVYNAEKIVEGVNKAVKDGAKIVLFPELSITAYTCGDLFFQRTLRQSAIDGLRIVCQKTAKTDAVVVVGLPLVNNTGKLFNVAAVLFHGDILGIVPKTNLPNYNEFYEKRFFSPAIEENSFVEIDGKNVPFGTDIIFENTAHPDVRFAVEICEDLWVANSPSSRHTGAGATLILNLSASNELVTKSDYRKKMVEIQSAKTGTVYAYCSSGDGESTSDVVFSAHNIICENGFVIAESKPFEGGYAIAEADFGFIENERARISQNKFYSHYVTVKYNLPVNDKPTRVYDRNPFVPKDKQQLAERCALALNIQSHGLKKRLLHTHADKLVLGVSGGSDSTLALIVCKHALELCGRKADDIIAVTMPCFGTSQRTLDNSLALAKAFGATLRKIDISAAVKQHLQDISHDLSVTDTAYENAQARERTQVLMDVANKVNGIVVGTGDLSEGALGWSTFNGDHMSMYNVNGGIPKTFVRALIAHEAANSSAKIRKILNDVLDTPISPELLPLKDGEIAQVTEDIVGPYQLHDYFLFMLLRKGFSPSKVFELAKLSFNGIYDQQTIYKWLEKFIRRFFSQQFKRSCQPDGVKVGTVDLSKNNFRMPSDACCDSWLENLRQVKTGW
ncbi:nAD+ synthase [Corallococcus sp. CAG:1435]|nr:nAD+ synthase [Corallococcus sp. CAG:1435]